MSEEARPISLNERIEVVDVLRGIAVCGILIGNMQWNSGYGFMPPAMDALQPLSDRITHYLVHVFVEGKFYSIFSLLFGFGFALQIARADERGDVKATVFKRRLFWLLVIGVIHASIWAGDILSVYALMGFILLLFRQKSDQSLLKWALWLMVVPVIFYSIILVLFVIFAPPDTASVVEKAQADMYQSALNVVPNGGFFQIIRDYNVNMLAGRWAGLIVQMRLPKILAMFLLGFYAYRRGLFQQSIEHTALIRKVMIYGLGLGLICNVLFAWFSRSELDLPPSFDGLIGIIMYAIGVPALALGITALIVTLWQSFAWRKVLGIFVPVGRMALTNYLMQTAVSLFIFYGWGLGYYGKVGAFAATMIALAIFAAQVVISAMWLRYFAYGPMEWIWRQLTYRKRLNLKLSSQTDPISS
ncbi:MAG TPA: DUF418 domain-containing protein [Pyrinomonadaceae bacterium]|nr:DUF418 domain-containing protein [Pyrinomonadaceae bacterium]